MNKHFNPAISEEKFAAWLDGMLPADEMKDVGSIIESSSELQECAAISSSIDTDIQNYINNEFLFQTDMEMLENTNIDIPTIETQLEGNIDIVNDIESDNPSIHQNLPLENDFPTPIEVHDDDIASTDISMVDKSVFLDLDDAETSQQTDIFFDLFTDE